MRKFRSRCSDPADSSSIACSPRARMAALDCCLASLRVRMQGRPDNDFFKFVFEQLPADAVDSLADKMRAGGFTEALGEDEEYLQDIGRRFRCMQEEVGGGGMSVRKAAALFFADADLTRKPKRQRAVDSDGLANWLGNNALNRHPGLKPLFIDWLQQQRDALNGQKEPHQGVIQRLDKLGRMFRLSRCATDLFFLLYLLSRHRLGSAISFTQCFSTAIDRLGFLIAVGRWPEADVRRELQMGAPLLRYGLMDSDLDVSGYAVAYVAGLVKAPLHSRFYMETPGKPLPLEAHADFAPDIVHMRQLIAGRRSGESLNILFHGTPGTGKTELARSLGRAMGLDTYEIRGMDRSSSGKEEQFRLSAIHACVHTVDVNRSLIIVDEADDILNCGAGPLPMLFGGGMSGRHNAGDKGSLNQIMDSSKAAIIWITNASSCIEESTLRRFDYSLEFARFTTGQRYRVWKNALEKHRLGCLTDAEIDRLAGEYPLNAGGIELAVRNAVRSLRAAKFRGRRKAGLDRILEAMRPTIQAHMRITGARSTAEASRPATAAYSLEGLSITSEQPLAELLAILRGFSRHVAGSLAGIAAEDVAGEVRNMNVLLHGPPGTGKTEFAKYLARELGCPLHVRLASDLLDKYVGESEKNIRAAFRDAEREKAVLLLDEADSLLHSRGQAQRSWEVTQVNEVLSNMESFRGILVCTTNFKDNLDPASLRRFNLKVGFDYLTPEGVTLFYRRMLATMAAAEMQGEDHRALAGLPPLTPGDFKVVRQKYGFLSKAEITHARLIAALGCECEARRNGSTRPPMGFRAA